MLLFAALNNGFPNSDISANLYIDRKLHIATLAIVSCTFLIVLLLAIYIIVCRLRWQRRYKLPFKPKKGGKAQPRGLRVCILPVLATPSLTTAHSVNSLFKFTVMRKRRRCGVYRRAQRLGPSPKRTLRTFTHARLFMPPSLTRSLSSR